MFGCGDAPCRILRRIATRVSLIAGALCAVLLLAACGSSNQPTASSTATVRLDVTSPSDLDGVRDGQVEIRGTVKPATATVTVRGRKASISGGSWSASVALEPGVNVVDVVASKGSDRPALTAVRVRRLVDVTVPDVTGLSAGDARQQLADAHLTADLQTDKGGFFDELLGGSPKVCQTSPAAGDSVDPGSTVVVQLARNC